MNNINLQWKSTDSVRPINQYSSIIKGITEYKSIPPKCQTQISMFNSQYMLGSKAIKNIKSQFQHFDCTASNEIHGHKSSNELA
jgi:hypothetical protein